MTKRFRQLFKRSKRGFKKVGYVADGKAVFADASTVPYLEWPDGRSCVEANLYMDNLWSKHLAHSPNGGTLKTYASYLAPLIRACFLKKGKSFSRMTDGDFTAWVEELKDAKTVTETGAVDTYDRTTIGNMCSVWLDFLSFLGEVFHWPDFVGSVILATRVPIEGKRKNRRHGGTKWSHASIPVGDAYHRRFPLSETTLERLRVAVKLTKHPFLRRRRRVMLEIFDAIGFRRIEGSILKVAEVKEAIDAMKMRMLRPSETSDSDAGLVLKHVMRKQFDKALDRQRAAPISAVTLGYFEEYLAERKRHLKRIGKTEEVTEGCFFINVKTGRPLEPNTFTQEFWELAQIAKIRGPCSPHMARARYITREFVRLVQAHHLENADDFRRALLSMDDFKTKVALITGHADPQSLNVYIDLAIAEVANLAKTRERVEAQRDIDAVIAANARFKESVEAGEDVEMAALRLSRELEGLAPRPASSPSSGAPTTPK